MPPHGASVAAAEPSGFGYEERYLRLRDEHGELLHRCHEQEDTIRRMNTKLAQIEKSLKLKHKMDAEGAGIAPMHGGSRNREQEQLIDELYKRNHDIQRENSQLKAKNKALSELLAKEKLKVARDRLRHAGSMPMKMAGPTAAVASRKRPATSDPAGGTKLSALVDRLKGRLGSAEEQLEQLREENKRLRVGNDRDRLPQTEVPGEESEQVARLQRDLREAQTKVALFQTRYEHLEARERAQHDLHEGSVDRLEEANKQLRELRRALQDIAHERDLAAAKASRADDLEETAREMRQANRRLEDQLTRLCENPFLGGAHGGSPLSDLEKSERASKVQVQHLQETAQRHHQSLLTLQKEAAKLRADKERAEMALQELRLQYNETEASSVLLTEKMRLYSGNDDDITMEELERALTIVRRRLAAGGEDLSFLEASGDEKLDTVPSLRRKLQQVQVANLTISRELERAERMLKAQMSINRDLHLELEELTRRGTQDRQSLSAKLIDFESLALERLTAIRRLEAQVKQLVYSAAKRDGTQGGGAQIAADGALLQELTEGDFGADENIVQVWVVGAELDQGVVAPGASSFFVIDFFDYESQATQLVSGSSPRFDFAATFKVTVDDFLLKYLGTESLVLELHQTRSADFEVIARCHISLSTLLQSTPRIILRSEPLLAPGGSGSKVVGYVHVELRMAMPVTELYQLFLQRHPEERTRLSSHQSRQAKILHETSLPQVSTSERARMQNELEVIVESCEALPQRAGGRGPPPSPYVHYQLLGFQDVFSSVVTASCDPKFSCAMTFPVVTDARLLKFLRTYQLDLTVMDDLGDGEEGKEDLDMGEGLIGEAKLPLAALSDGKDLQQTLTIMDETGHASGKLVIKVRWRLPLQEERALGPNVLTGPQVEDIIARFSPSKDGQVRWVKFLRWADPPPAVGSALWHFRTFLEAATDSEGLNPHDVFKFLATPGSTAIPKEEFVSGMLKLAGLGVPADELYAVYDHIAFDAEDGVTLQELANFTEPLGLSAQAMQSKLQVRCQEVALRGASPSASFQAGDPELTGRISRLQFKQGLKSLGFVLVDEPDGALVARSRWHDPNPPTGPEMEVHEAGKLGGGHATALEWENQKRTFEKRVEEVAQKHFVEPSPVSSSFARKGTQEIASSFTSRLGPDSAAVRMQAQYRGYLARKEAQQRREESRRIRPAPASALESSAPLLPQGDSTEYLLAAEDSLAESRKRVEGVRAAQDLRPFFHAVDRSGTGFVNRTQFAISLRRSADAKLSPTMLKALMDHFCRSHSDPDAIDYAAFVDFTEYQPPDCSPAIQRLRRMVFHGSTCDVFAKYDTSGNGFISRVDLVDGLREVGYASIPSAQLAHVAELFETSVDSVDYAAFVAFVREQEVSASVASLESRVRNHLLSLRHTRGVNLRDAFGACNISGTGMVSASELSDALARLGFSCPQEDLGLLFKRLDPRGAGLSYADFMTFLEAQEEENLRESRRGFVDGDVFRLQRRAQAAVMEVAQRFGGDLELFNKAFRHYDWRATGRVGTAEFVRAMRRSGFPFTSGEAAALAEHFGDGKDVDYPSFLAWATPDGPTPSSHPPSRSKSAPATSVGGILLKFRRALDRMEGEVDGDSSSGWRKLSRAFERVDDSGTGTLTQEQLSTALDSLALPASARDVAALMSYFGEDPRQFQYKVFLRDMNSGAADGVEGKFDEVRAALAREMRRHAGTSRRPLKRVFESLDVEGRGFITALDLTRGLSSLGIEMAPNQARKLIPLFDPMGRDHGEISYDTFVRAMEEGRGGHGLGAEAQVGYATADKLVDTFAACVKEGIDFRTAFDERDEDYCGILPISQFRAAMRDVNSTLTEKELEQLEERFTAETASSLTPSGNSSFHVRPASRRSSGGEVNYLSLLHWVDTGAALHTFTEENSTWYMQESLRLMIRKKFSYRDPGGLRKAFKHFDRTRKGSVGESELSRGLAKLGFSLSAAQDRLLLQAMDLDGDGVIDYPEFIVFVRDANHSHVAQKFIKGVRGSGLSLASVQRALASESGQDEGLIHLARFSKILRDEVGVHGLSRDDVRRLAYRFDANDDGFLSIDRISRFLGGESSGSSSKAAVQKLARWLPSALELDDVIWDLRSRCHSEKSEIPASDFIEVLMRSHTNLTRDEMQLLARSFRTAPNAVCIEAFAASVAEQVRHYSGRARPRSPSRSGSESKLSLTKSPQKKSRFQSPLRGLSREHHDLSQLKKSLACALGSESGAAVSPELLRRSLRPYGDGKGSASARDLLSALVDLDVEVDRDFILSYFAAGVDLEDFVALMTDQVAPLLRPELREVLSKNAKKCQLTPQQLQSALEHRADTDGLLTRRALRRALEGLGFHLSDSDYLEVMDALCASHDGCLVSSEKISCAVFPRRPPSLVSRELDSALRRCGGPSGLLRMLEEYDVSGRGKLTKREWEEALADLGVHFTHSGWQEMEEYFGDEMGGTVDYEALVFTLAQEGHSLARAASTETVLDRVEARIRSVHVGEADILNAIELHYDVDARGEIPADEFRAALARIKVNISEREAVEVASLFAGRGPGRTVRYRDFVRAIKPLHGALRRLNSCKDRVLRNFRDADALGVNYLSKRETKRVLERSCQGLDSVEISAILNQLDVDGTGRIHLSELRTVLSELG
jgi:Ca2+-binding EF-hand superfamily protein